MPPTRTQDEHRARLLRDLDAITAGEERVAASLDARQLTQVPRGGGWSVGQVFEHLIVSDDSYLIRIRPLLTGARRGDARASWRPSLAGRLLVHGLTSSRKLPAPKIYVPAAQPRPRVVDELRERRRQLRELLESAAGVDWRRTRLASPVSWLIRLNLGDAFTILVVHAQRHLKQMERIAAEVRAG